METENCVVLCLRFDKNARHKLESVNFNSDVISLKDRASHVLNLKRDDYELLYHGQCLKNDKKLDHYGLKPGSTVDVIKKRVVPEPEIKRSGPDKVKQLQRGVMSILAQKSLHKTLKRIIRNEETIENLKAATPGLDRDVIALGLIQDLEMFILATAASERETLAKIIQQHPTFADAALQLIATVSEEGARARHSQPEATTSAEAYAIDRASDEEFEDDEEEEMEFDNITPRANQALPPDGALGTPSIITTDFFRLAMRMATGGSIEPPASMVTQAQLNQLRDMGITDEAVARRALEQSGGDIQLALEMIFGDGM